MTEKVDEKKVEPTKPEIKLQYVRLVTGEAVVAEVKLCGGMDNPEVKFVRPLQIYIEKDRRTGVSDLILAQWLPVACTEETSVFVSRSHIMYMIDIMPKISEYVLQYADKLYERETDPEVTTDLNEETKSEMQQALKQLNSFDGKKKKLS